MILAILSVLSRLLGPILPYLATWAAAKRDAAQTAKIRGLEADKAAGRRMDNADVSKGSAADDTAWLRDRAKK